MRTGNNSACTKTSALSVARTLDQTDTAAPKVFQRRASVGAWAIMELNSAKRGGLPLFVGHQSWRAGTRGLWNLVTLSSILVCPFAPQDARPRLRRLMRLASV